MYARRRSQIVCLTLAGSAGAIALAGTLADDEMRRNLYPDRGACERDYTTAQCEPATAGERSGSPGYFWHGPFYYADRTAAQARRDPGPGRTGQVTPVAASARGGFGGFARAMRTAS